jgi:hypothetical protein
MNYTKPELAVLGKAAVVIESQVINKSGSSSDGKSAALDPAYDLDE